MTHIRIDDYSENSKQRMLCGIGPTLPEGDRYVFAGEHGLHHTVDCPDCGGPSQLGTPLSELSGRPGHPGYAKFCQIAESWGY